MMIMAVIDFSKAPWDKIPWELKVELAENVAREDYNELEWAIVQIQLRKALQKYSRQGYRSDLASEKESSGNSYNSTKASSTRNNTHGISGLIGKALGVSHEKVRKREQTLEWIEQFSPRYDNEKKLLECKLMRINRAHDQILRDIKRREIINTAPKITLPPTQFQLHLMDFTSKEALKRVPRSSIDVIVTDPPYDFGSLPLYSKLAYFSARELKEGGIVAVYAGQYYLPKIIEIFNQEKELTFHWMLAAVHTGHNARMYRKRVFVGFKPILVYFKGKKPNCDRYFSDVMQRGAAPDKLLHEWEQKVEEADDIINKFSYEGQIVCDPMAGTGTTAVAALKNNRRFVGFEINKETGKAALAKIGHFIQSSKPAGQ
jgi:16S rRNA G966 N2-methylase RsmD